jgi:hypothetical protein
MNRTYWYLIGCGGLAGFLLICTFGLLAVGVVGAVLTLPQQDTPSPSSTRTTLQAIPTTITAITAIATVTGTAAITTPTAIAPAGADASLGEIRAEDGSFTAKIPQDWKANYASTTAFEAENSKGETVYAFTVDVPTDADSVDKCAARAQEEGRQVSQDGTELLKRFASPRLRPIDVPGIMFPKLAPGGYRDFTIVESQTLASNPDFVNSKDLGVLIHHRFTSTSHKNTNNRRNMQMEGAMVVFTRPVSHKHCFDAWNFITFGAEAPVQLFEQNNDLYFKALSTLKYDSEVVQKKGYSPVSNDWISKELPQIFKSMLCQSCGVTVSDN